MLTARLKPLGFLEKLLLSKRRLERNFREGELRRSSEEAQKKQEMDATGRSVCGRCEMANHYRHRSMGSTQ